MLADLKPGAAESRTEVATGVAAASIPLVCASRESSSRHDKEAGIPRQMTGFGRGA
jgi:hypothetical protein